MNANLENKIKTVAEIKDKFSKAKSVVFVDYKGTNVKQITQLRADARRENAEYKVYKNKLMLRALEELGIDSASGYLEGTTAVAISYDSEVAPAKLMVKSMTDNKNLNIKFGLLSGKVVDSDYIQKLSSIPPKDVLIAQLLGMLQMPVRSLAVALNAIAEKR